MWRLLVLVALAAGCASAGGMPDGRPAQKYADGMEYYVPSSSRVTSRSAAAPTGVTQYFQVNTGRICSSFRLPGTWEARREAGSSRRLDGKGLVGVWLFSVRELGGGSVQDAIRKVAERSVELYAKEVRTAPWTLERYPRVPDAWQWTMPGEVTVSGRRGNVVPRWYLPIGDAWIAQFTIDSPPDVDPEAFVASVLESLTTSNEPRCYEARLRELGVVGGR